ncbi:hypothetical protein VPH35_136821 [Triticum aestivum]
MTRLKLELELLPRELPGLHFPRPQACLLRPAATAIAGERCCPLAPVRKEAPRWRHGCWSRRKGAPRAAPRRKGGPRRRHGCWPATLTAAAGARPREGPDCFFQKFTGTRLRF